MDSQQETLTEEQKLELRRHARRWLRTIFPDIPDEDRPPLEVIVVDDDGKEIKRVTK